VIIKKEKQNKHFDRRKIEDMKRMLKVLGVIILAIVMLGLDMEPILAQESSTAPYSGDLWHRSTLTGD
jgi:hypothetical protein